MNVFVVTGASRGIGAAVSELALASGYRIVRASRSCVEKITDSTWDIPCDVASWDDVSSLVSRVEGEWGRVNVMFANAGTSVDTSFVSDAGAPPPEWTDMVLTNVCGPAFTARAAMPALLRSRGHLVLTGSAAGRGVRPGNLYSATKWAVTGLAEAIRAECVGTGVRVTLLQPGLVDTGGIPASRANDPKLDAADVARAVLYAVSQPPSVDVNEILVRPTGAAR